jgi:hypothetical protein
MDLELWVPHLDFQWVLEFELFRCQEVSMHFGGIVEQLFFELLLSHLLLLNFESFGTLRKSQGKCWVDILIFLPLDLKVIWTKVEDLSEHSQSKAFALGHRDALLHFF